MFVSYLRPALLASGLLLLSPAAALAVTVTTTDVTAVVVGAGTPLQDSSQPRAAVTEDLFYTGPGGFSDIVSALAVQDVSGFSQVALELNKGRTGLEGIGGAGLRAQPQAIATRTVTVGNDDPLFLPAADFDFRISGVELEVYNATSLDFLPSATLSFQARALRGDGSIVDEFFSQITLTGISGAFVLSEQGEFTASFEDLGCNGFGACFGRRAVVDPLSGKLALGILDPGEVITISTTLTVATDFVGREIGAQARGLDPNGLTAFGVTVRDPSVVPLPASAWLLVAGFGALGLRRRRKSA